MSSWVFRKICLSEVTTTFKADLLLQSIATSQIDLATKGVLQKAIPILGGERRYYRLYPAILISNEHWM